ncbi:hypothetical protein E2C01_084249 [Portunus trituberculatus]|uniref:Uncharacterized protein n=1 Tax=Portunus trituberculatus TaxID=210409 RepID=A0A5B7J3S0_PORTR|nr:hypothetical protein [Portunus trituberculatus]
MFVTFVPQGADGALSACPPGDNRGRGLPRLQTIPRLQETRHGSLHPHPSPLHRSCQHCLWEPSLDDLRVRSSSVPQRAQARVRTSTTSTIPAIFSEQRSADACGRGNLHQAPPNTPVGQPPDDAGKPPLTACLLSSFSSTAL